MKSPARLALLATGFNLALNWAAADAPATNAASGAGSAPGENREMRMISFLPAEQQTEVMAAYHKAIADNPDLLAEEKDLRASRPDFQTSTEEERMAFVDKMRAHGEKLRAAMVKEDPKVEPILTKIDEHHQAMRAKHQPTANAQ
jgi:hypothetical protein